MHAILTWLLAALGLFAGMLACMEWGRYLGKRRLAGDSAGAREGFGAVDGAVFGLLGLLVAFTFSGAMSRFDQRRTLVVQEANAVGTAWLRLDLLAQGPRAQLQELFRQYLDARLAVYAQLPDLSAARAEIEHANRLQADIWRLAVPACHTQGEAHVNMLLLPALNEMFDLANMRTAISTHHPPLVIYLLLFGAALGCSVLVGNSTSVARERSWLHLLGFSVLMATAVYVILDLEYPRMGLIRVDQADQVLFELRASMK